MFIFYNYENVYTLDIICQTYIHREMWADVIQMLKNDKIIKLTVNTGQVMFSGEIYYYWPLNSSEKVHKIVGKTSIFFALSIALLTQ